MAKVKKTKKITKIKEQPVIEQKILPAAMDDIMGDRYAIYAKEVIQNRAIPDVRDGLKPVQRRIIFAMADEGNTFNKPTKKCAHTVGSVMGKYHPHGDSSIYEALARMSQTWVMRYPLIDFQGNNGSIDGDSPAAYRYTESRLAELSAELVRDIDKETVDMQLTFDDTSFEPTVLPSRFPNLLLNGASGIAVGVATEIPPHNFLEVAEAIIYRIGHKRATVEELRQFVLGPDFPTGGTIYRSQGLDDIYLLGRGRVDVAAKTSFVVTKDEKQIIVHEIPYGVNKTQIIRDIDSLCRNKRIDGLLEVRDESDREGLRIVVDLKADADENILLEYLFNKTQLRTGYSANMVAIVDGRPRTLNLLAFADAYIVHQKEIITRRSQYDLKKNRARLHIVDGLIAAISQVDAVVKTIRASVDKNDAKNNLQKQFAFTPEQAEAIVMLQLYKLTNTDITTLENEKSRLEKDILELEAILANEDKLNRVIIKDLRDLAAKYGDARRTKIEDNLEVVQIDKRDLVAKETVMVAITRDGYIKRSSLKSYKSSGDNALPGVKQGDLLVATGEAQTTDYILAFTNMGNYLYIPVFEIVDGKWKDEGKHINYLIPLRGEEKVIRALDISTFREDLYIVFLTADGKIKRTSLNEFNVSRFNRPINCMRLAKGDQVVDVTLTTGNSNILVVAEDGRASYFNENDLSPISLKAGGVLAMKNVKKNKLVEVLAYHPEEKGKLVLVTIEGHARIIDINYLQLTERMGRVQLVYKSFKSDPQKIVFLDKIVHRASEVRLNLLLNSSNILPVMIDDLRVTPVEKYAKRNIEQLTEDETIAGVYYEKLLTVDETLKSYEPPVVTDETKVVDQPVDEDNSPEFEQISIFDVMGD
ncbi:MAG TPA: DNA topoisomerase IV subunit A [Bacilli bacterium]|jgi:topoisomerase-4 subunit A|nr:DNA topoisomerase IV subunit A [Bacilli bacterium]MDD3388851.1 DNA topoisomerase IV subunit A [Bacilli bacterium]MDD4344998.1 DNA topoisomerase IV subunit A [Bacilli bacterium]MDD4520531.1 DNA topoisomerase IV subunit A [Bacilli bacterium]MDY0399223.1 DNA topoisomerase IV subunit A [Bacilli bacterium]